MWKFVVGLGVMSLVACGSSGETHSPDAGDPCPFAGDFAGAWTFSGTETTTRNQNTSMPSTSTVAATFPVTVDTTGCMCRATFPHLSLYPAGVLAVDVCKGDVVGTDFSSQADHGSVTITRQLDGTMAFDLEYGWDRQAQNGDNGSVMDIGTLAR